MLELLDSDRLAAKAGKWRSAVLGGGATLLMVMAAAIMKLVEIAASASPKMTSPLQLTPGAYWIVIGLFTIGVILWIWAVVMAYQDQVHGAYIEAAERYKADGR